MSGEFPTETETEIGFLGRFQTLAQLARRHFHTGRGGRAKLAISTSLVARIVTAGVSFIVLPITVRYLGNEGYGLMAAITTVVGWLQFTNMGIGLGLQNALTEETAERIAAGNGNSLARAFFRCWQLEQSCSSPVCSCSRTFHGLGFFRQRARGLRMRFHGRFWWFFWDSSAPWC